MSRAKIILSYLVGLLLSMCLLILALLLIIRKTIFDKSFMYRVIDENNYYVNVYNRIDENVKDYMMSSGLEEDILDGVIEEDNVKKDAKNFIDSIYKGEVYIVNTEEIESKLRSNINDYLKKHNLGVDNTSELDMFISDIGKIYKNEINLYDMVNGLAPRVVKYTNIIDKVIIVDSVIVGVLFILMIVLNVVSVGSSILSSGISLILVRLFIFERIDSENVLIISDYFSLIIRNILRYINNYLLEVGLVLVISGFIISLFRNKKKKVEKK